MNSLVQFALNNNPEISMNSKEISDLVECRHSDAKRSIDRLVNQQVISHIVHITVTFVDSSGRNRKTPAYGITSKADCYAVIAQLSLPHLKQAVEFFGRTENALMEILTALAQFDVPDGMQDMFVYAIRETESGRIKLGISADPQTRLKHLQTGNSQHLELVAYVRAKDRFSDERAAHHIAKSYHIRGEWFAPEAIRCIDQTKGVASA